MIIDNPLKILLIIPVHNESENLYREMLEVVSNPDLYPFEKILLIENGSRDNSFEIAQKLAEEFPHKIMAYQEMNKGIGHAYHRGLIEALHLQNKNEESFWAVCSAADMPFKNSDIQYFLNHKIYQTGLMAIGSKAHKDSVTNYTFKRKCMSTIFYLIRKIVLGMNTVDCQGTMFVHSSYLSDLLPKITARNFFYSTELTFLVEKMNITVVEMPIVLKPEIRPSTVRPIKDGMNMLRQTFRLFFRFN